MRCLFDFVHQVESTQVPSLRSEVLKGLERPGTTVFAGHDTTLNALQAILGALGVLKRKRVWQGGRGRRGGMSLRGTLGTLEEVWWHFVFQDPVR